MSTAFLRRSVPTVLLLILCLAASACANKKINKANYEKIKTGMTLKEVQDIFGEPGKKEESGAAAGVAAQFTEGVPGAQAPKNPGSAYVWERGEITITVYFDKDGKVTTTNQKGL
jgi:hypothetical protein